MMVMMVMVWVGQGGHHWHYDHYQQVCNDTIHLQQPQTSMVAYFYPVHTIKQKNFIVRFVMVVDGMSKEKNLTYVFYFLLYIGMESMVDNEIGKLDWADWMAFDVVCVPKKIGFIGSCKMQNGPSTKSKLGTCR